jgi:hypothetical protein
MKRRRSSTRLTGLNFFDPVIMENCLINAKAKIYIRQIRADAFVFGAVQTPLSSFPYDPHLWHRSSIYAAAPHEAQAKRYWPISDKALFRKRLEENPELSARLFSESGTLLTSVTFKLKEIELLTGIIPQEQNVRVFDTSSNQEHVAAVERARLTETIFFEWLKGYFEHRIQSENIEAIQEAVRALDESEHGRISETHSNALKELDITEYARDYIMSELKQGTLSLNTDADIESLVTLKTSYSSYAEQYCMQTELSRIVEMRAEELLSDSPSPRW